MFRLCKFISSQSLRKDKLTVPQIIKQKLKAQEFVLREKAQDIMQIYRVHFTETSNSPLGLKI